VKKFNYVILIMLLMFVFATGNAFADTNSSVNGVEATGNANNIQTFEASDRAYVVPGGVQYGHMPGYFGDNNKPGHQFISLDKLMMYNTSWNIKASYPNISGLKLNYTPHTKKVDKADQSKVVICTKKMFDTTKVKVQILGVGTINSSDKDIISSDLLDKVLYNASLYGATHIQFLGEGTNTELQSSGWGIGLSYTKASDTSVSTGGTGFSTGWAGYHNLPWQQFFFLKVIDPAAVASIDAKVTEDVEAVEAEVVVDEQVDKAVKVVVTQKQTGNHTNN